MKVTHYWSHLLAAVLSVFCTFGCMITVHEDSSEDDNETDDEHDSATETESESDSHTEIDSDTNTDTSTDTGSDTESDTDTGTDSETDSETDSATDTDTDIDTDTDTNSEIEWKNEIRITTAGQKALYPAIAVNGDDVYLAWTDDREGNDEIYFKRSTDRGLTWEGDVRLTNESALSQQPELLVDTQGNIHLAWRDERGGTLSGWYIRSFDRGSTWTTAINLTEYPDSYAFTHPQIAMAADSGHIYIVWHDNRNQTDGSGWHNPYYRISSDGGATWTATTRLTLERISGGTPDMAVDGFGGVHVVWNWNYYDTEGPTYKGSLNSGVTWAADVVLKQTVDGNSYPAVAATTTGDVTAVYRFGEDIYYRHSGDFGLTWDEEVKLNKETIVSPGTAPNCITAEGENMHAVWFDFREGETNAEIYYMTSSDGGASWSGESRLTNADNLSQTPVIAAKDGIVHVAWRDNRNGNWEIFYNRSQ